MTFTDANAKKLLQIIKARRDVRGNRFNSQAIEEEKLSMILEAGISAPSVSYSQPWKQNKTHNLSLIFVWAM